MRYITKNIDNYSDEFTEYIINKYDLVSESVKQVMIPIPDIEELSSIDWNIFLVVGNSGSGKSTIINELFKEKILIPRYDNEKPIISQFKGIDVEKICNLFESVGLSSIPVWLHTPNQLSAGEFSRFELAYNILKTPKDSFIIVDEFTSLVNRECALSMSYSLQRYIREKNLKIILASCHFDVIEWLQPDIIFNLNKSNPQLERIIYDNLPYKTYQTIEEKDILTFEKEI